MFKLTIKFDIDMLLLWLYNWSPFSTVAVLPITSHISVSVYRSAELQMIFGMTVKRVEFRKQYYKIVFNISSHFRVHQPWMFILKKVSVFFFQWKCCPFMCFKLNLPEAYCLLLYVTVWACKGTTKSLKQTLFFASLTYRKHFPSGSPVFSWTTLTDL